jgi:protein tyrosine/serine phosphatase
MIVDAGGLPVTGGGRIREGQLLRVSGGLVTERDLPRLEGAGLRSLIDLRGGEEPRTLLEGWAAGADVRYVWLPIDVAGAGDMMRAVADSTEADDAAEMLLALYRRILDDHGTQLARAIDAIADGTPVAFGCAAGKDRTGLVTALLHSALGVSDDDVVRSYAAAPPPPDDLRAMLSEQLGADHSVFTMPRLDVLLGAEEATMRATLMYVRERYGGVAEYLCAQGLAADRLDRLRADLVVRT